MASRLRRISRLKVSAAAIASLMVFAQPAIAGFDEARQHFMGTSDDDQVEVLISLIATGDFNGFYFQGFSQRLYSAIVNFESREGLQVDGILLPYERERLKERSLVFFSAVSFQEYRHPRTGTKLMVPRNLFDKEVPYEKGLSFSRGDRQLTLSFAAHPVAAASFEELYDILIKPASDRLISYSRLRADFLVVTGENKGRKFYTIMRRSAYGSEGFTLTWGARFEVNAQRLATMMANALMSGQSQNEEPPQTASREVPRYPAQDDQREGNNSGTRTEPRQDLPSTGTGFKVTAEGHLLTNFHVAGRCRSLTVSRNGMIPMPATLVASDEQNDLALIKTAGNLDGPVAAFHAGPSPRAGTEIAVYGFPLAGLLSSSGNIVTGNITSLSGMRDNSNLYQISAPVQPGNSGGPVMDKQGNIVAVVVSKLNAQLVAAAIDDIPQNVNFAIKGSIARNFLEGANVKYETGMTGPDLDTPSLAERAQAFTFMIGCTP
jgi:S1-C subfamily serine protease